MSLFQVLTSLSGAFYQTLGKTSFIECHSRRKTTLAQTLFAKSQTLDKEVFAKRQALGEM